MRLLFFIYFSEVWRISGRISGLVSGFQCNNNNIIIAIFLIYK